MTAGGRDAWAEQLTTARERLTLRRFGLRSTVTLFFAVGALIVSTLLALGTYLVARHYLIDQREQTALRQTYADASFVADGLRTQGAKVPDVLGSVGAPSDAELVVRTGGRWFSSSIDQGPQSIPAAVREGVESGTVTFVWTRVKGDPAIVIGVPLRDTGAQFYEVAVTTELASTLTTLAVVLTAFALLSTVAGAVLGRIASARVMSPLDDIATAAARIGAGGLQTRLPPTDDPDLATIVGSFNSMVEALDERIQRDARFAADLGHELRSPLTTLVASVQLIERRRDELPERTRRAVDLVSVELGRFQQTLEDLLELGRLDAGVRGQVLETVDAGELVRETLAASHRDLGLLVVNGRAPTVDVDKGQLSRSLVNLLDNADRHAGGVASVTVTLARGRVRIEVADHGPGVPEADRDRIFERFVRGGSRGSLPGSGLGLSIVAETVHQHGGRVWCESTADGASFVMDLPSANPRRPRWGHSELPPAPTRSVVLGGCRGRPRGRPSRPRHRGAGMRRRLRVRRCGTAVAALLLVTVLGACGLPRGGAVTSVPDDKVPYGLLSPTPTATQATGFPETAATVYLVDDEQHLLPVAAQVANAPLRPLVQTLLNRLAAGPTDRERARGLLTDLAPGSTLTLRSLTDGTATIQLQTQVQDPSPGRFPIAIGQVVLTATSVVGVDRVVLLQDDGSAANVPVPPDGDVTTAPLVASNYTSVLTPGRTPPARIEPLPGSDPVPSPATPTAT